MLAPPHAADELLDFAFAEGVGVGHDDEVGRGDVEAATDQVGRGHDRRRAIGEGTHLFDARAGAVDAHAAAPVALAVLGAVGHVAAQLLDVDAVGFLEAPREFGHVAARPADHEDARFSFEVRANQFVGSRELLGGGFAPHSGNLVHFGRLHVERHRLHRDEIRERADAFEEAAQLVGRRRGEQQRTIQIFEHAQMLAFVEGVHVVDDRERAAIEDLPKIVVGDEHRAAHDETQPAGTQAFEQLATLAGRDPAVNLADFEVGPVETLAEIRAVLADEIARRRDQADVAARSQRFGDGDAHHDFGLPRAGRSFE